MCREWALVGYLTDCQLLVSELVTNAVVHGAGPVALELQHHDGALRVGVTGGMADGRGSARFEPRTSHDDEETGRGLSIVDAVAADWGTWCERDGTFVWFELRS